MKQHPEAQFPLLVVHMNLVIKKSAWEEVCPVFSCNVLFYQLYQLLVWLKWVRVIQGPCPC